MSLNLTDVLAPAPIVPLGTSITVFGPASLSNLGPGFDTLGLCIEGCGDIVEAYLTEEPGVRIEAVDGADGLSLDPLRNTASVAAAAVLRRLESSHGLTMRIRKGIPAGSGIGSSAASAVAGAYVVNALYGSPLDKSALVPDVLEGEYVASGGFHGDNVLPALLGGLLLVSSSDPEHYRRVALPRSLPIALLQPRVQILTKEARAMLPEQISLRDAVRNASALAFLVDAFRAGDWEEVGRCIMEDRLVEPVRARLLPCYEAVRAAALEAGALGCALSGSGPAMFALTHDEAAGEGVREAMETACRQTGIEATSLVTYANPDGARFA